MGNPNWVKGTSGNPGGRPKDSLSALLKSKKHLPEDLFKAVFPLLQSQKEDIRLRAAEFLRDTRDGKPTQNVGFDSDSNKIIVEFR